MRNPPSKSPTYLKCDLLAEEEKLGSIFTPLWPAPLPPIASITHFTGSSFTTQFPIRYLNYPLSRLSPLPLVFSVELVSTYLKKTIGWDGINCRVLVSHKKSSTLPGLHNLWLVLIQISSKFYPQNAYMLCFSRHLQQKCRNSMFMEQNKCV